jgi:hypothetical protein
MDQIKVKKTCHVCGADVTHAVRHKNRLGEYLCAKCLEVRKQSSRHRSRERLLTKYGRFVLYVLLAGVAGWIFFELLDVICTFST